jgi:cytidine deaminase
MKIEKKHYTNGNFVKNTTGKSEGRILNTEYRTGRTVTRAFLLSAARTACGFSYAPYSGTLFGAALLGADNMIYTGCSVENAAFPASLCAERVAACKAVSRGCRDFHALAVVCMNENERVPLAVPCALCRTMLIEFSPALTVILEDEHGAPVVYRLSDLLPETYNLRM